MPPQTQTRHAWALAAFVALNTTRDVDRSTAICRPLRFQHTKVCIVRPFQPLWQEWAGLTTLLPLAPSTKVGRFDNFVHGSPERGHGSLCHLFPFTRFVPRGDERTRLKVQLHCVTGFAVYIRAPSRPRHSLRHILPSQTRPLMKPSIRACRIAAAPAPLPFLLTIPVLYRPREHDRARR